MSRLVLVRSLVLVLLSLVVLSGCGGSGGVDSEHDLVPAPEVPTDTNTTPDTNGTQSDDSNDTTGGGSDDGNATGGGNDTNTTVRLSALKLTPGATTLNKDHNTTVTLTATYSDNTTKPLTSGITWIITPSDAVTLHGTTLTAHKDTNVTVQAKVGTTLSNKVNLNIYWEVNGHRLPPEPDPAVNNATLLGIDSNHNGVRDDVERWIYKTYDYPIERGVMLQNAQRFQAQISDINKAHEYSKLSDKSLSCEYYLEEQYKWFQDKYEYDYVSKKVKKIQFNTIKRYIEYEKYNGQFNGEVFDAKIVPNKNNCLFDANGNLKVQP